MILNFFFLLLSCGPRTSYENDWSLIMAYHNAESKDKIRMKHPIEILPNLQRNMQTLSSIFRAVPNLSDDLSAFIDFRTGVANFLLGRRETLPDFSTIRSH